MDENATIKVVGKQALLLRNELTKLLPEFNGIVEFSLAVEFTPSFDGLTMEFALVAHTINVKTGEMSELQLCAEGSCGEKE